MRFNEDKAERRIFERFSARFPARFKDSRDDYGSQVFLRDASASGMHILSRERMYLDDPVALEIALPDGGSPLVIKGKVIWTKSANAVMWDIGLRFPKVDFLSISRLYKFTLQD